MRACPGLRSCLSDRATRVSSSSGTAPARPIVPGGDSERDEPRPQPGDGDKRCRRPRLSFATARATTTIQAMLIRRAAVHRVGLPIRRARASRLRHDHGLSGLTRSATTCKNQNVRMLARPCGSRGSSQGCSSAGSQIVNVAPPCGIVTHGQPAGLLLENLGRQGTIHSRFRLRGS